MTPSDTDSVWNKAREEIGNGRLSVLMPAHNLESAIAGNIRTVCNVLRPEIPFEVIVIDDGSSDATAERVAAVAESEAVVELVRLEQNVGKGAALRQGFHAASGSHVLFLDADLDLPPHQVHRFFDEMVKSDADVVIGSKMHPDSELHYPLTRKLMSSCYFFLVKLMFGLPIHDTQTGLKLFRRRALEWAFPRLLVKRYAFDLELLVLTQLGGCRIAEAPVLLDFHGSSSIGSKAVRTVMHDTLAIFYRVRILGYYQAIPDVKIPDPAPLVSIMIAYPSATPNLLQALASIERQDYEKYEVILLPDALDGRKWPEGVREIPTGAIRPAEKRNIGIREARGELVAFLDDDAYPVPEWLRRAVEHFSNENVIAVGGPGCTPATDSYMAKLGGEVYANRLVSGTYRYRYVPTRVLTVDDCPSCNLFVRTDALRKLNGFRTEYWPGEDTYLCMELVHTLGGTIVYAPWAVVHHHRRELFLPHLRQIGRYALHRGYFARHVPATSRRLGYMMPSLFVAGLALGGIVSVFVPLIQCLYLVSLAIYAVLTLAGSVKRNVASWLLVWLGIMATHVVYGTRFIMGWFTPRLPSQIQPFDHSSEGPADAA